jgi:DNA-binding transcriptional ArsR family regulator
VNERTAELAAVHARYFPPKAHKQGAIIKKADTPTLPDDARLLELARNAKNGAKFARLYDAGDTSGHGSDDSAADLALCVMLAYWTRKDADRMDRLFRQSALMRDKWDEQRGEKTYGALTISKAIELQENTYTPGTPRETPTEPDGLMDGQWDELEGEGQVTTPTRETIKTWALTDLLSTEFPEPEWVVPDLLPTGEAILAGRPKLGKSFLALQLALALGAGARFLDRPLVKGRCLYIALEDSPKRLQRRLRGMKAEAIEGLDFAFRWPALNEPAGIDALATAIHRDGLRLVVIDTIARAIRGRLDWDDIAQVTAMLGQLQELAMATDCCILLIDHHRKGNGQGGADAVDDVMGSTGKSAVADTIWGLYRKRGERTATLAVTGRDVEEETLALSFDHLTLTWQAERDGSGKPKIESVQGRILRLIEDWGEATTTDLADALGMTRPHVSNELAELLSRGAVVRGARVGRVVPYTLPEPHRESVNDVNSMNRVNRVNGESSDNTDDSYYSHDSHHNGGAHMPDLVAAMTLSGARQPGDPF